jgi:hypothetical protein
MRYSSPDSSYFVVGTAHRNNTAAYADSVFIAGREDQLETLNARRTVRKRLIVHIECFVFEQDIAVKSNFSNLGPQRGIALTDGIARGIGRRNGTHSALAG